MYVYLDVKLDADNRDDYLAALAREGKDAWDRAVEWRSQELWHDTKLAESSVPEVIRAVSARLPLFDKGDHDV